jgi:hypothetical protein
MEHERGAFKVNIQIYRPRSARILAGLRIDQSLPPSRQGKFCCKFSHALPNAYELT